MSVIKFIFVLLATILINSSNSQIFDQNLVVNFFKTKSLHFGYVLGCFGNKKTVILGKFLMKNNLRISINNVKNNNLSFMKEKFKFSHHFGIIIDATCADVDNMLKEAGKLMLFNDVHHWLVIASNDSILTNTYKLNLNINTNLYVAIQNKNKYEKIQNWTLIDVYNQAYKRGGVVKINTIGFYNKEKGFQIKYKGNKYWKRRNMTEVNFKSETVLRQPLIKGTLEAYLEPDEDHILDPYNRFHCRLIHYCKEFYNFSLNVKIGNTWGYKIAKGNFTGITGDLQKKEIDFACAPLFIKPERVPIIDYAIGLWKSRVIILFRQPTIRSFSQIFLHPMATSVWFTTLAIVSLIIITLKLNQKFEFCTLNILQDTLDQAWSSVILFSLGAFFQQGSPQTPATLCGRIITISILTFCLMFYQFYSGSIVSSLLTKPPIVIKTAEDLLHSALDVGSDSVPYIKDYFHTTKNPVAIAIFKQKMLNHGNSSNFYPPKYGLKLVENENFAYQVEIVTGYTIIGKTFSDKAICELGEVEMFTPATLMSTLQKNSPFRDMLNYCIQRLAENGIGDYQNSHWGAPKPECRESSQSISFNVGLKEIYPAIVLLFIGIFISLMVLGIEIFVIDKAKPQQIQVFNKYFSKKKVGNNNLVVQKKNNNFFK